MLKSLGLLAPVAAGVAYFGGVFDPSYERVVDRSPDQVTAALADFHPGELEGAPGSDPSRSGGVSALFRTERTDTGYAYVVMSGDDVATRMFADIRALDDGRTKVVARVERGNAPDDFTSPAFRSEGTTMALFGMALEDELNKLTLPRKASVEECREILESFDTSDPGSPMAPPPNDMTGRMGQAAKQAVRLGSMEAELRRNGCDTSGSGGFQEANEEMLR